MARILKIATAVIGTAAAVVATVVLWPRTVSRRRAEQPVPSLSLRGRPWHRETAPALAATVEQALRDEFGETASGITVKVERGTATLRGEVDDIDDISRIAEAARGVPGVSDVDNLLRLRLAGRGRPTVLSA